MNNSIYSAHKLKELARRLDRENNRTPCHSENVASLAVELCKALGIRGKKKDMIITACLIHDIGKAIVDRDILSKGHRLTDAEKLKIRLHPAVSARLASEAGLGKTVIETIYYHHIWFNGRGYPANIYRKGSRIPIGARILAVCDAYESMMAVRAYKDRIPKEEALAELRKLSIKQFDPKIVEVFSRVVVGGCPISQISKPNQ